MGREPSRGQGFILDKMVAEYQASVRKHQQHSRDARIALAALARLAHRLEMHDAYVQALTDAGIEYPIV